MIPTITNDVIVHATEDDDRKQIEESFTIAIAEFLESLHRETKPSTYLGIAMMPSVIDSQIKTTGAQIMRRYYAETVDLGVAVAQHETFRDQPVPNIDQNNIVARRVAIATALIAGSTIAASRKEYQNILIAEGSINDFNNAMASQFAVERARKIAVTETTELFNETLVQTYTASNWVTHYQWLSANDHRVCPICSAMAGVEWSETEDRAVSVSEEHQIQFGQIRPIGQMFIHPGGRGSQLKYAGQAYDRPPAHPLCRCRVISYREQT